jgi:hypothetical protein
MQFIELDSVLLLFFFLFFILFFLYFLHELSIYKIIGYLIYIY